jgi:hypothetical protein
MCGIENAPLEGRLAPYRNQVNFPANLTTVALNTKLDNTVTSPSISWQARRINGKRKKKAT